MRQSKSSRNNVANSLSWRHTIVSWRSGLAAILSLLLILANFVLQFFPVGWLAETNLLLHIRLILALSGLMLAWAL